MNRAIIFVLSTLVTITACKKRQEPTPVAGKGGNATLNITPQHHGKNIDSCMIYIKYNTSDMPSSYDDSVKCVPQSGKPVGTFTGLKAGNYYIYGKGWDPNISQKVIGGKPYTITTEQSYDLNLAVTEGD